MVIVINNNYYKFKTTLNVYCVKLYTIQTTIEVADVNVLVYSILIDMNNSNNYRVTYLIGGYHA